MKMDDPLVQEWALDTANRGDAFAWRHHLQAAGLDPASNLLPRRVRITTAVGRPEEVPIREACLWLVSNIPALRDTPWRVELKRGLPFRDVPALPDPQFHRPLIGVRALRGAKLKVELDFANDTLSVWTPDA
jgi:hypothetical protein